MNSVEKNGMKELEAWIEQLMECKQLSENQVKKGLGHDSEFEG